MAWTHCPVSSPLARSHISAVVELVVSACIITKLATPGRVFGSYVTSDVKSVMARFIFFNNSSGVSRNVSRLLGLGSDFDCFFVGSRSDLTRALRSSAIIDVIIGNVVPNFVLNILATSRPKSICCRWSSPHGTCVALETSNQVSVKTYRLRTKWIEAYL